jgi:hypothetical protein
MRHGAWMWATWGFIEWEAARAKHEVDKVCEG